MNRFIIIENEGILLESDIFFIGNSSKRDSKDKIGFFGSGWKYALSYFMRNDMKPIIYTGLDKIVVDIICHIDGRGKSINAITINGQQSSITTDMGPKWTAYMALREMISNSIDEGNHKFAIEYVMPKPVEGKTIVILPARHELCAVIDKFDDYFAFNRTAIFENEYFKLYRKPENRSSHIYRKGILCHESSPNYGYDFDFKTIDINEDRLASQYDINSKIQSNISTVDEHLWNKILLAKNNEMFTSTFPEKALTAIKECINDGYTFVPNPRWKTDQPLEIPIPSRWYFYLIDLGILQDDTAFMFGASSEFYVESGFEEECELLLHMVKTFEPTVNKIFHGKLKTLGFVRFQYNKTNTEIYIKTSEMQTLRFSDFTLVVPRETDDYVAGLKKFAIDLVCANGLYKDSLLKNLDAK